MGQDMAEGTAQELILISLLGPEVFDNNASFRIPVQRTCIIKWVEYPKGHLTPQDWYSDAAQALAQLSISRELIRDSPGKPRHSPMGPIFYHI